MASLDFDYEEARFQAFYDQQRPQLEQACATFVALLSDITQRARFLDVSKVEGRVKDRDECIRKFSRKYRPALEASGTPYEIRPYITDLIGVRVVCLYEDELERVADAVHSHFDVMDVTDKVAALESTDASFGYKGLHLDLRLNPTLRALPEHAPHADQPFELQVRTIIQDAWSVLDHKIRYKKAIAAPLRRRINVLSALFELADREFRQIRDATDAELLQAPDETAEPAPGTEAAQPPERPASPGSELNAFTFLKIAHHFFKDFEFEARKVEQFVDDIVGWSPVMTRSRFNTLLRGTLGTVKRYKQHFEEHNPETGFNPYTVMRHCLYLSDRQTFLRALRPVAREAFEAWLTENPA
jgi:ppGpp synthetase/RelA/SpoT-type nucleotidyltranferase